MVSGEVWPVGDIAGDQREGGEWDQDIYNTVIFCCCSIAKLCPTHCDLMDCSRPGFPVLYSLPEFAHVHWVSDTMILVGTMWQPTPVLLPGKYHGRRGLVGYSPWGRKESDSTKWLHFHFSLSCTGEGNGNPLQCSCLETPKDGGAWWAAVYGVAQSWTQLKQLSMFL